MTDYKDLIVRLKLDCRRNCKLWDGTGCRLDGDCSSHAKLEAAAAIEELLRAASAMHTWIFLNTDDEEAAYYDCGLSPEMNAALGSMGGFEMEVDDD